MPTDAYVGRMLDTVDDLGIRDNTIFVFTADNGPEAADFGNNSGTVETSMHGSPGPWRGTLFTGFKGALRVPFAIRWPGKIPAGTASDEIVHEMDLFPTFAKFAGGKVPQDRIIDGIDMADDDVIEFNVKDTGIGISEEDKPYIFKEFFTSLNVSKHSSGEYEQGKRGLGLGLAIAKKFIEMHGGQIGLKSTSKKGSCFYFTIPVNPKT